MTQNLRVRYKSLRRDPMLDVVVEVIQKSNHSITFIANKCGVSQPTIRNWMSGKTRRPQHITMEFVLRVCGYETTVIRSSGHNLKAIQGGRK